MKKNLFSIAMLAFFSNLSAQKNAWYVGGNVGFGSGTQKTSNGSTTTTTSKSTSWQISPEVGTFLTDNVQVGLGLTFNGVKTDSKSSPIYVSKGNSLGGLAYVRNFFGKDAFRPFVGFNINASKGTNKLTVGSTTTTQSDFSNFGANINAGFGYALSKRITALGSFGFLGFSKTTNKIPSSNVKETSTSIGFNAESLGNRFNIGFYYTFKK